MFDYDIYAKVTPPEIRRGTKAKITVEIVNANKKVAYCAGGIKGYKMNQRLNSLGDGKYFLSLVVPMFVPKGVYIVRIFAVSKDNEKGPIFLTKVKII